MMIFKSISNAITDLLPLFRIYEVLVTFHVIVSMSNPCNWVFVLKLLVKS